MREMKDSGIEFIGLIPVNWEIRRMKSLGNVRNGLSYSPQDVTDKENGTLVLRSSNIKNGKLCFTDNVYVSCNIPADLQVQNGDILICSRNGSRELIGKNAIIENVCASFGAFMMIFRCETPNYLYYILNSPVFSYYLGSFSTSTINQLTGFNFCNMKVAYCSDKGEQERITGHLNQKCTEIDSLISDIQKQIEMLEQYKRSVITEAVTKGLDPDVEMKDSGVQWIGDMPANWSTMPNKYVMRKVKKICPKYNGEQILSLTMNGVIIRDLDAGGKMPTTFDGYQYIEPDNLLMCLFDIDVTPRCIGLIKDFGLTSPAYSQFIMSDNAFAPYYVYYYTMIDNDKTLLHLAKNLRHSLTEEQLGAISVIVPPYEEQKEIADYLDSKIAEIDSIIALKKQQIETIEEYKKSLIFEYVTGKISVESEEDNCEYSFRYNENIR